MSEPDAVLTSLGAYVLGALSPTESAEVEEHLRGCAGCRGELAGLAGLPGLLGSLDQTDLEHLEDREPEPDQQLLERTLLELTRRRRAQRRRSGLLTAAAVLVVATTVTTLLAVRSTSSDRTASTLGPSVSAANTTAGVHAEVRLTQQPWGTALHLVLRGVPPSTHCQLLAVLANGQRQTAGSWQASYEGAAVIDAAADAPLNRLTGVEVVTDRGVRLVSVPLASG